jgi:hypothetical protein
MPLIVVQGSPGLEPLLFTSSGGHQDVVERAGQEYVGTLCGNYPLNRSSQDV